MSAAAAHRFSTGGAIKPALPMHWSALISAAVHFFMVLLISLLMHPVETRAQEEVIPVRLVPLEDLPAQAPAARMTALRTGPMPGPSRDRSRSPGGGINPEAPRPKQPPAPPRVLTAKGGTGAVPRGVVGGTGTKGEGAEPAGPTYGPGFEPGPLPVYPKNALDQNLQGTVTLRVTVSPSGRASAVAVSASSGHAILDEAARRAVARWTFSPGMKNGKPAEGTVTVTIRFANNTVEQL